MRTQRFAPALALTVLPLVLVAGCTSSSDSESKGSPSTPEAMYTPTKSHPPTSADPTRLSIPSIKLDKPVKSLGVAKDGSINPPSGVVQWFNESPAPGKPGNSVIAGHVTYNGPDVFANLSKLTKGQKINVGLRDGTTRIFQVARTEAVNKGALQHRTDVWGQSKTPNLILITCDSNSGWADAHHHVDNYVVWATPVATAK